MHLSGKSKSVYAFKLFISSAIIFAVGHLEGLTAAFPANLTYQGSLKQSGVPYNGTQNMTFKIYDALTGGVAKWTISQAVPIKEGLYRVELAPDPNLVNWGSTDYFLETCLGGNCLSPREKLSSVPSAMVAKDVAAGATAKGDLNVTNTLWSNGQLLFSSGSATNPGIAFMSDRKTGLYRPTTNTLSLATGGSDAIVMDTQDVSINNRRLNIADGTSSAPGLRFYNEPKTGIFHPAPSELQISLNGIEALDIYPTGHVFYLGGQAAAAIFPGSFSPSNTNMSLGGSAWRWTTVYTVNGVVQTSSSHLKRDIKELAASKKGFSLLPVDPATIPTKNSSLNKTTDLTVPRGIMFKWKNKEGQVGDKDIIGFMGDDLPEEAHSIREDGTRDPENFYTSSVVGILCAKAREQDAQNKSEDELIQNLIARLTELEKKK